MLDTSDKKAGILCIAKILEQYTDSEHPLTMDGISQYLENNYNLKLDRNSISRHLKFLREEFGYSIERNANGWYLSGRTFDDSELRVLVDGVLSSKYIPEKTAKKLIDRIADLGTPTLRAKKLTHVYSLPNWIHQRNKDFFLNLELIEEAIRKQLQISFTYNEVQTDGSLQPKYTRSQIVHPFAMICAYQQYYLICSIGSLNELRHYRIDKITGLKIRENKAITWGLMKGYTNDVRRNIGTYAKEHNLMFGGIPEDIVLKMPKKHAGNVYDNYGSQVQMKELDDKTMEVRFKDSLEGARIFAQQYGSDCEVIKPDALRKMVKEELEKALQKYE